MSKRKKAKRSKKKARKKSLDYTPLQRHHRRGKSLIPPMMNIGQVTLTSWMNQRMPDMLWAVLVISQAPRDVALDIFRHVAGLGKKHSQDDNKVDITHSKLELWNDQGREELLELLTSIPALQQAIRPVLLFQDLPLRDEWEQAIGLAPEPDDWSVLADAVTRCIFHQSESATDCRWLRLLFRIARGQMMFAEKMADRVEEIVEYPNRGDLAAVRAFIRAGEGGVDAIYADDDPSDWPETFWSQCLRDTDCLSATASEPDLPAVGTTLARVREVREAHFAHCLATQQTSALDARHDGSFGLSAFALGLLEELLHVGASQTVMARSALRTLLEVRVTLGYLRKRDDENTWKGYREFGAGQTKLAFHHLDRLDQDVDYVDRDDLEELANEDLWHELRTVNVGHWDSSNLRELSDRADLKDTYDTYYPWTSTFAHGHWGAVRDATFESCRNPLHRFHRIPRTQVRLLEDVLPDAVRLVDGILGDLETLYPPFPHRVAVSTP